MALTINLTIGERIAFSERIPKRGNLDEMKRYSSLKHALVGFGEAQMKTYRIVPYNGTLITASASTATSVELSDEQVLAYAALIREMSTNDDILLEEADKFSAIMTAAAQLEEAAAQAAAAAQSSGEGLEDPNEQV